MEIFKLFGSIFVDNDQANQNLNETDQNAQGVGATFAKMGGAIATAAVAVGVAAVAAGAAIFKLATDVGEYSGMINDAAKQSSLSTDNIQELKFAAEQSGVAFEDITKSAVKMNTVMADALNGNKAAAAGFNELGIALVDANGKAKSTNDVYNETIAKLAEMGDTSETTRIGTDLFGKGFANLKPLLAEGAGGIEDLKNKASELGLVMGGEAIAAGDQFADTLDTLKGTFGAVGLEVGSSFVPILQKMADWIIEKMPIIQDFMDKAFTVAKEKMKIMWEFIELYVMPIFEDIKTWVEENWPFIETVISTALEAIVEYATTMWEFFKEYILPILNALWSLVKEVAPSIMSLFKIAFDGIVAVVKPLWLMFKDNILPIIGLVFKTVADTIPLLGPIFTTTFKIIGDVINGVIGTIKSMIEWTGKAIESVKNFFSAKDEAEGAGTTTNILQGGKSVPVTVPRGPRGLAAGGELMSSGIVRIGETGPEDLFLPQGAMVMPLSKSPGAGNQVQVVITGNTLLGESDSMADKLGDIVVTRLRELGVF